MKKLPLILSLVSASCLLGICGFLVYRNQVLLTNNYTLQERNNELSSNLSAEKGQIDEKASYAAGQKEYISELTAQLADCQKLKENPGSGEDEGAPENAEKKQQGPDSEVSDTYPELYSEAMYESMHGTNGNPNPPMTGKTVYLTFDDGPSDLTPQVLDLLDEYNAKATFFVVYKDNADYTSYLKEIVARGHTLAIHSYSHDYKKIYQSVDAFLEDFQKVYDWVYETTGQRATLFRFPGGSTNGSSIVVDNIIKEMERRGFIYYDWNVSSGDGSNLTTTANIIENICDNVNSLQEPVVLMHDGQGKEATLKALPAVLKKLSGDGYAFHSLDVDMKPVQYQRKSR